MDKVDDIVGELEELCEEQKKSFRGRFEEELVHSLKEEILNIDIELDRIESKRKGVGRKDHIPMGMVGVTLEIDPQDIKKIEFKKLEEERKPLLETKVKKKKKLEHLEGEFYKMIERKWSLMVRSAFFRGADEALELVFEKRPSVEEVAEIRDRIVEVGNVGSKISKGRKKISDANQFFSEILAAEDRDTRKLRRASKELKDSDNKQKAFLDKLAEAFYIGALCTFECAYSHYPTEDEMDQIFDALHKYD